MGPATPPHLNKQGMAKSPADLTYFWGEIFLSTLETSSLSIVMTSLPPP